jgi:hypothetical protein
MKEEPCSQKVSAEILSAWRSNALVPSEQQRLTIHVSGCLACQQTLAQFERIASALRIPPLMPPQIDILKALHLQIATKSKPPSLEQRYRLPHIGVVTGVCLLLMAFFAVFAYRNGVFFSQGTASTATTPPKPTLTNTQIVEICGTEFVTNKSWTQVEDFAVSISKSPLFETPEIGIKLPDTLSLDKPYSLGTGSQDPSNAILHASDALPVPMAAIPEFTIQICNLSSDHSYRLDALGMKVGTLTSYTGTTVNIQPLCWPAFSSKTRLAGGGCGYARGYSEERFRVTWPNNVEQGTEAKEVKQVEADTDETADPNGDHYGTFPTNLPVKKVIKVTMEVTRPIHEGTFTFQIGIKVDGKSMIYTKNVAGPALWVSPSSVHEWTGAACEDNSFFSKQIPTTGIEEWFLCPKTT